MAQGQKRDFAPPVFRVAGKEMFLEVYDNLDLGAPKMSVQITTYKSGEGVTNRVTFYFDPQTFFGFCDAILTGTIDNLIPCLTGVKAQDDSILQDNKFKTFPANHYGIPRSGRAMRHWIMKKSSRGNYEIYIQERERQDQWNREAPELGKASFFISPFHLIAMASTSKSYLERKLLLRELQNQPLQPALEEDTSQHELGIE